MHHSAASVLYNERLRVHPSLRTLINLTQRASDIDDLREHHEGHVGKSIQEEW